MWYFELGISEQDARNNPVYNVTSRLVAEMFAKALAATLSSKFADEIFQVIKSKSNT